MTIMPVDLWLLFIAVGVVLGAISLVRHGLVKRAAKNWPQVQATVEMCYAVSIESGHSRSHFWIPILGYSYKVNGERYSGSVGLDAYCSNDKDIAEQAGNPWRGQRIIVRFNPQKPEKSVFLREDGAPPRIINYADEPPGSDGMFTSLLK